MIARRRLVALLVLVGLGGGPAVGARAEDRGPERGPRLPVVEAAGDGVVSIAPDQAMLSLGVTTEAATAREAMEQNAARTAAVLQALAGAGFTPPAVSTQALRLSPVYDQRPNQPSRIVAYRATNQIQVKTPQPTAIGRAIDAAVAAGANVAAGLAFSLADPQAAQLRALRLATEDAQRRARVIADALGRKLARVVEVRSIDLGMPEPRMMEEVRTLGAAAPATPIEPGLITVRARVLLRAELE